MAIDLDKFLEWAEDRFDSVVVSGDEVQLNTPFADKEDNKHKLWCNPKGGKKKLDNGVFHCWKTEKHGSLITLVQIIDTCDYPTAVETLGGENSALRELEQQLEEFFKNKNAPQEEEEEVVVKEGLSLPPYASLISDLPSNNFHRVQCEVYLFNRKLSTDGLMTCTAGPFKNRIIIPYYDRAGKLIYFNGRYIGTYNNVGKYKGPHKDTGVGKEDVIYMPHWPPFGAKIYLTEGEFDAISIYISGTIYKKEVYAAAFGGKNLSDKQIEMLRPYRPVLCLDSDGAGKGALAMMSKTLMSRGIKPNFVRPPKIYKDWNKMLEKVGHKGLLYYLFKNEKVMDEEKLIRLLS